MGTKTFTNDLTSRQYDLYDYLKEQGNPLDYTIITKIDIKGVKE